MKKIRHAALVAAVGAIGLAACDAAAPPDAAVSRPVESKAIAVSQPAEFEAIAARETFAEVLRDVLRDEDPYSRARRLGALLPTLGPEAVPAVKQTLEDQTLELGGTEIELLVRLWATHQPEEASRWAVTKSPQGYRVSAVDSSVALWAEADPRAAAEAVRQWTVYRVDVQDALAGALVRGWFATNPPDLEQFIYDIGMGFQRQHALIHFIRVAIRKRGADAVMRWAESIPEDRATYKKTVYGHVGSALALLDLEAALRWCAAQCDGRHGKDLRGRISRRWVLRDGPAAMAWLSSAPEGYDTDFAVRVSFAEWGEEDREAAVAWMAAQIQRTGEPDPWLRPALPVYARLLVEDSPVAAIEWAERIEDEQQRNTVLIQIARKWREADKAAAEAWLRQSSLSEENRKKARAPRARPGRPPPSSG